MQQSLLIPISQRLHAVHDRTVQSIRSLHEKYNAHPTVQSPQVRVLVPLLSKKLVHIDGGVASAGAGDDVVLLSCGRHD
jgi:hypothetical protein